MMAVIKSGSLWTCQHIGLDGSDGDYDDVDDTGVKVDRSGVQWIRLGLSTSGDVESAVHGRIYDNCQTDPWWYYMPSVMGNHLGDMVAGFSGSKTNAYMSAFCTWRRADGSGPNRPVLLKAGTTDHGSEKVGEYSYTTLDPADSSGLTFWTVQQFAQNAAGYPINYYHVWGTWITRIELEP